MDDRRSFSAAPSGSIASGSGLAVVLVPQASGGVLSGHSRNVPAATMSLSSACSAARGLTRYAPVISVVTAAPISAAAVDSSDRMTSRLAKPLALPPREDRIGLQRTPLIRLATLKWVCCRIVIEKEWATDAPPYARAWRYTAAIESLVSAGVTARHDATR